jgi:hypothetical protein
VSEVSAQLTVIEVSVCSISYGDAATPGASATGTVKTEERSESPTRLVAL